MLTSRFEDALQYAVHVHGAQVRKGTSIPYVSHLLAVSGLVLEAGGDENVAISGLLHDAAEDGGGENRLADIRARFGDTVAEIVKDCSDSLADDPRKKASTTERKRLHLEHLDRDASESALLVTAADKLHNARCILADYRTLGEKLWDRFKVGQAATLAYYESVTTLLESRGVRLSDELRRTVDELKVLVQAAPNGRS
jgi:(p)ppGpp synthase/HD superfamily hydrolase